MVHSFLCFLVLRDRDSPYESARISSNHHGASSRRMSVLFFRERNPFFVMRDQVNVFPVPASTASMVVRSSCEKSKNSPGCEWAISQNWWEVLVTLQSSSSSAVLRRQV